MAAEHIHLAEAQERAKVSLAEACLAEIDGAGMSRAAAARAIGISPTALSQWLRGEYPGDSMAIEHKVSLWLTTRREAARRSLAAAGLDHHRDLEVTDRIATALSHAQAVGDVVLIHGQSGAGKSWAADHYCRTHSAAYYVPMTCAVRTLSGLLGRIGHAVGAGARHGSALDAETAIMGRLQDRGALLAVDECHHLSARLLDELRCIRDAAKCGLALVGDDAVRLTLARCPQIVGRIGIRVGASGPSEEDVAALAAGIAGRRLQRREIKAALAVARSGGGLHALRRFLARAWLLATADGRSQIALDDFEISAEEAAS